MYKRSLYVKKELDFCIISSSAITISISLKLTVGSLSPLVLARVLRAELSNAVILAAVGGTVVIVVGGKGVVPVISPLSADNSP